MSRKHLVRLGAFLVAALLILLAMRHGGGGGVAAGARGTPGAAATAAPVDTPAARQGEFRRRNPFRIVRVHPPPPPPTQPAPPPVPVALPPPTQAPEKPLPLRLVGTIAGDPLGVAFLKALERNFEFSISLGGNLVDHLGEAYRGVVLTEVRRKQVAFSRGTKTWTLDLGDDPKGAGPPVQVVAPVPAEAAGDQSATLAPTETGTQRVVNRAEVEQNLRNLGYLITQLNVQPFFQNGQPSGFRVSRIRPGSFVDKMGARNGDIVQGVNGKPIRTIKDAFLLYNSFKTEGSVQIQVIRDGSPTTLGFQLR